MRQACTHSRVPKDYTRSFGIGGIFPVVVQGLENEAKFVKAFFIHIGTDKTYSEQIGRAHV